MSQHVQELHPRTERRKSEAWAGVRKKMDLMVFVDDLTEGQTFEEDVQSFLKGVRQAVYHGEHPLNYVLENKQAVPVEHVDWKACSFPVVQVQQKKIGTRKLPPTVEESERAVLNMVKKIVRAYPWAVKSVHAESGMLPLHCAVAHHHPVSVIELLLRNYPVAIKQIDSWGKLPLHVALCCAYPSAETVEVLLNEWPDSAKQECSQGVLPLHYAMQFCSSSASHDVIAMLLDRYPQAAEHKSKNGEIPLHNLTIGAPSDLYLTDLLLQAYPGGARSRNQFDQLPLHVACEKGCASKEVLQALIHTYPDAARIRWGSSELLPLHMVLESDKPCVAVVRELITAYPEGVRCTTGENTCRGRMLPLHIALNYRAPADVVHALLDAYPEGVSRKDGGKGGLQMLPLHLALHGPKTSIEILATLLSLFPEAAQKCAGNLMLPLHLALWGRQAPVEAIQMLIAAHPEATSIKSINGMLPLHIAVSFIASSEMVEIVKCLIEVYPEALREQDDKNKLPMDLVRDKDGEHWDKVRSMMMETMASLALDEDQAARLVELEARLLGVSVC